jgi:hypothetical protein
MGRLTLLLEAVQAAAGDDEELQGVLQKHLLRGAGAEAVDALLRFHVRHVAYLLAISLQLDGPWF